MSLEHNGTHIEFLINRVRTMICQGCDFAEVARRLAGHTDASGKHLTVSDVQLVWYAAKLLDKYSEA